MDKSYKRKNYYHKPGTGGSNSWNSKKKFKNYLQPGMKGFLCTCNIREKDCVRESYNILNEYADKLYATDEVNAKTEEGAVSAEVTGGDIEDELKREVSSLKSECRSAGRFNAVDTGVKNNIFIKTTLEDPVKLAVTILNDIAETKTQKARFVMRIVPVEVTCRANLEDIKTAADTLFEKHFRCEPTTFAVVINKRYNDSLLRDEVIHALALLVTDRNRDHKANLKDAKYTVLLEIMKGLCCISVLEDYKRLRHYNVSELAKPVQSASNEPSQSGDDVPNQPTGIQEEYPAEIESSVEKQLDSEGEDKEVCDASQEEAKETSS